MKITLFEQAEFLQRLERTRQRMKSAGIDLLLVASPANQFYLTGYDGWSFYTPQMVLIHIDEPLPIWYGRRMDAVGARFTVYMPDEYIVEYPDNYVATSERHPMQFLASLIKERGWSKATIGVEMDDYYYTARWHQILTSALPECTFQDAFLLINWVRLVKSETEIQYMMEAGQLAMAGMQAALDTAAIGVRQSDVMGELYKATVGGTEKIGGTFPCKPPNAMVGELCAAPHLSWTDQPLRKDEMFYIEMGGTRHRYHSPLSRCIYMGTPPAEISRLADVVAEGLEAVLAAVRPGRTLEELEAAWKEVISRHGIEKDSRIGYPVGIGYPPTWGELTCSLRAGDKTVMEENMTFHCIPALWLEKYGLVISESFVVTKDGAKTFADFPRQLFHRS
ncbi:M24 family metallopeptidase [uncultured Klebsiella sp.]|uniref:M24 family metallopeptidase n=1 Tax=uncultured Klebsiella sp. TaxID=284011 RepID=UPI00280422FC|nr:M24 family metallopeptidase [uncultured Klebsiella sp.]